MYILIANPMLCSHGLYRHVVGDLYSYIKHKHKQCRTKHRNQNKMTTNLIKFDYKSLLFHFISYWCCFSSISSSAFTRLTVCTAELEFFFLVRKKPKVFYILHFVHYEELNEIFFPKVQGTFFSFERIVFNSMFDSIVLSCEFPWIHIFRIYYHNVSITTSEFFPIVDMRHIL